MATDIFLFVIFAIGIHYFLFLEKIRQGLNNLPESTAKQADPIKISVIIPFRNEEQSIGRNITGIINSDWDKELLEVIYVDDASTDGSQAIVSSYLYLPYLRMLIVPEDISPLRRKKTALLKGIESATGEIIVTTDADCWFGPQWLSALLSEFSSDTGFVSGPVAFTQGESLFARFQQLEFAGLVLTGAGLIGSGYPVICNGANIAYRRDLFFQG